VATAPPVAATISVDGQPRNDWGMWTHLPPGTHEVCFGAVADFTPPPCQTTVVTPGTTTTVVGSYAPTPGAPGPTGFGWLRATATTSVAPSPEPDKGVPSQIVIDGMPRDSWGTWLKMSPGPHQVCFTDVEGFSTPGCQTVTVSEGQTATVNGVFVQRGFLRVATNPAVPATISVDGVVRNDWGMWTHLPTGPHQVCFGEVPGYITPPCQVPTVAAGTTTVATGEYANSA
jgi:hypothetical protein